MESTFKINKVTCNAINIEWLLKDIRQNSSTQSMPCTLIADTYPVCFTLSFQPRHSPLFGIKSSRNGRAIIKFAINNRSDLIFMDCWTHELHRSAHITLDDRLNTTFTIRCNIIWLGCTDDQNIAAYHLAPLLRTVMSLNNTQSPDFHMNINNQKLSAHKAILAYHSSVLAAMLQIPMKESKENEMTIEDIDYSTMETVLKIIYTGETEDLNDIEVALKVLKAGEKYQMPIVKAASERKLLFVIKDDNVLRLLDEADRHNASSLCHTCVEYIMARGDEVLPRAELKKIAVEKHCVMAAAGELAFDFLELFEYYER